VQRPVQLPPAAAAQAAAGEPATAGGTNAGERTKTRALTFAQKSYSKFVCLLKLIFEYI
jgi:hypothetical protein